jgi:hypothetical protein
MPFIWLLLKRRADKSQNREAPVRQRIDWKSLLALRPQQVLTGEIWLKSSIAAFVALRRRNHRGLYLSTWRRLGRGGGVRSGPDNRRSFIHADGLADTALIGTYLGATSLA